MAGSLNHIIDDTGQFRMDLIENLGDAEEALAECHQVIAVLLDQLNVAGGPVPKVALANVMSNLAFPMPAAAPAINPDLHGAESVFRGGLTMDEAATVAAGEGAGAIMDEQRTMLIWSNEHQAWWRPNSAGYTALIEEAGRYTPAEAQSIVTNANASSPLRGKLNEIAVTAPEGLPNG